MLIYQLKIVIKLYKTDEFVKSTRSFARKIRKEKGCLGYREEIGSDHGERLTIKDVC